MPESRPLENRSYLGGADFLVDRQRQGLHELGAGGASYPRSEEPLSKILTNPNTFGSCHYVKVGVCLN